MAHEGKRHSFAASGNTSVSSVYKKNLNNLINSERTFTDMGMDMGDMSWTAKPNSLQQTNIDRIKPVDEVAIAEAKSTNKTDVGATTMSNRQKNIQQRKFEAAKKEAAANAAELMAEMKVEEGNFNIKRDILASQAIENQQNISADKLRQTLSNEGEEFGFTKVGQYQTKPVVVKEPGIVYHDNATYTDTSGTHRNALGEKITTDMDVGKTTDEDAFAAIEAIKNEEKTVITTAEYTDPHKYNRDRKGQIITNTPAHNQLHDEVTRTPTDYTISGDAIKTIVEDEALAKDMKELAIEAKKLADAKELEAYKVSQADLAAQIAENSKQIRFEQAKEQGAKNAAELTAEMEQDIVDAAAALAKEKAMAEDKAAQLARINKQLDPIITQVEETKGVNVDSEGYSVGVNALDGRGVESGTAITANAKNRDKEKYLKNAEKRRVEGPHKGEKMIQQKERGLHKGEYSIQEKEGGLHKGEKMIQQKERGLHHQEPTIYGANINETWDRKESSLAVQLATRNVPMFMSDEDKEKMVSALDRMDEERHGGESEAQANIGTFMGSKDPFAFSTFAYPKDVTQNMENGHYILFYVNVQDKTKYSYNGINSVGDVVPVGDMIMKEETKTTSRMDTEYGGASATKAGTQTWTLGASKVFDTNIDYQKRRVLSGSKGNILRSNQAFLMKGRKSYQGLDSVHKTTTRITDSVALYLPPGISDNTTVSYGADSLGMAGFMAFSFGEAVAKWKARDFEGVADTVLEMGGTALVETMKTMGLGAFGAMVGADEGATISTFDKAFGQTVNPYIEVNFNSMGMRDFSYTFHFSPKSKQETQDVQDIITLFRFHMAPELKGTNHRYLTLPSTFDIHYMYQSGGERARENPFYNKIATCVLEGCNVDYTPGGVKSFADGAPTQINMTLNFKETKMLTKQKINDGF